MTHVLSRRAVLALAGLAALPTSALAIDAEELDPSDLVPRRFSVEDFLRLRKNEVYKVNLSVKRGNTVIIDGYTPSQSRKIIQRAAKDWPETRRKLARRHR